MLEIDLIDYKGFRLNVAMIILNNNRQVFWGRCSKHFSWQFPQGGIAKHEQPLCAMYRELREETGLVPSDVELIAEQDSWLAYKFPLSVIKTTASKYIGQKQKWFLLYLKSSDTKINLNNSNKSEFNKWNWVDYWYPIYNVVFFKRNVYWSALKYFSYFKI